MPNFGERQPAPPRNARGNFALPPLLLFMGAALGISTLPARGADSTLPALTNIAQVLAQGRAGEPLAPYPVRVRGVITQVKGWLGRWITIHDGTNGCAIQAPANSSDLRPGHWVEVEGELASETHFPYVSHPRVTVLETGRWPEPAKADAARLASGSHHAGWVKLQASVLDVARTDGKLVYLLASGPTSFNMWVEEPIDGLPLEQLNATLEVRGVAWSVVSGQARKPSRFTLHAGGQSNLVVLSAGSSNLWSRPPISLGQFAAAPVADERRVVRGTVTYVNPAGVFTMEDGTNEAYASFLDLIPSDNKRAQFVPREPRPHLRPGDTVEVVCTKRRQRAHSPWLEWAEVRVTGRASLPAAPLVTPEEVLTGQPDCRRVRLRGRVLDHDQFMQGDTHISRMVLQVGNRTTYGVFAGDRYADFGPLLGQQAELAGVPVVSQGNTAAVRSYTFYLSDPADVRVLPPPPVWMNAAVLKTAGLGAGGLALALGWVWLLRRQVRRQTEALRVALSREQELNQLKTSFVSMVSHEFRTPLGVIVSSVDILRRYLDRLDPETRQTQFDIILRSTGTLGNLIEDLLLLGKVEAGKLTVHPAPLDLGSLCRHLTDEVLSATHRACPIALRLDSNLDGAIGDESLLRQSLTNVLSNAVKYSPPGTAVEFHVSRHGITAQFMIRDQGIGIPENEQARLFEAFSRASNVGSRQGTGLGLVIARRCVELHGGRIEFESAAGAGTTFTIRVPLYRSEPGPAPAPISQSSPSS